MCGTYFHDLSRSQVRAWIYNSEPWNKFRRVLEILRLQGLQKKFWVHFHDSCVQKRSNMLWRLHALWKFSACKVSKKNSLSIFTIYASKNEDVCCEVQTHFVSSLLEMFTKKVLGAFWRYLRRKMKLFVLQFRRIIEVLRLQGLRKRSGHIFTVYASKNEGVCCEVKTHFGSSLLAKFAKIFWAHFQVICVHKRTCLLWSSDAFWTFFACKV